MSTQKVNNLKLISMFDDIIIGLPSAISGGIGMLCNVAATTAKTKVGASFGHILGRTFSVIAAITGIPLLVWNLAKVIFANLLNILTLGFVRPFVRLAKLTTDRCADVFAMYGGIVMQPDMGIKV